MQTDNRLFDDFVKFVNGAAGTLAGVARETEGAARERAREWIGGRDFVSREARTSQAPAARASRRPRPRRRNRLKSRQDKHKHLVHSFCAGL